MKILAFGAHPDDVEIGCGGTLAQLLQDGTNEALIVCMTSGEAGRLEQDPVTLAKVREAEAAAAAKVLGLSF